MPDEKTGKGRLTFYLSIDLIERLKNYVYWTPGMNLAKFAEEALTDRIDQIEKQNGKPFPPREGNLTAGRPMK